MPRRVSSPEFVGRGSELAALLDALDRGAQGEFAAVLLAGDSGAGKSRLLAEFEREAETRGARVLGGDCLSLAEGELPYAPVRAALRQVGETVDALLGGGRGDQARLFELLLGMFARLGEEAPVVLAIEDIHWADRSTLDFLVFLIANARRERLALVCSYRTDELRRGHPLRAFLAQHARPPAVERLELRLFTPDELAVQLAGILGSAPDPALVHSLYERTGGNAFFTEELVAASADGAALPASLRDALMLRIEALTEPAQGVLRVAATHGRLVTHRLLDAVCELDERSLHDALREAVEHQVLVRQDDDSLAFRHALFQETLAADLLPGERTTLHVALAEALERDPGLVSRDGRAGAEVCAHWLAAHRLPEALAAAVRAGVEAEHVYAFADATRHFERALELWGRVEDGEARAGMDDVAILARAAEAAHLSGDGRGAVRLAEAGIARVDARADPHRAARLRERLGRYVYLLTADAEAAQAVWQEGLELLPGDEPSAELAGALAAVARILMLRGRTAESLERSEQAITVAREVGARAEEAHALNTLGVDLVTLGDRDTGIAHLREATRMTEELDEVDALGSCFVNLADALDHDGRLEESAEVSLAGARRAQELGMREWRLLLQGEAAAHLLKLGRLDEADGLTGAALELAPSMAGWHQCAVRARLEVLRGRIAETQLLLDAADAANRASAGATWIEPLASTRVELELLRGRPKEARRTGEQALELAADHEKVFYTARLHEFTARADAVVAERARAAGDDEAAVQAACRAAGLVERIHGLLRDESWLGEPPPEAVARADACAAEAARAAGTGDADEWAALAARWAALGMAVDGAYARLREAEALVTAGERERAAEVVRAALPAAIATGARPLCDELESLARRARLVIGDEARRGSSADVLERLGLTDRERAVLELVAAGKTNRQIGEELFISKKTASVHVSRILSKLDVGSRVEAATAAQRLGIVP